MVRRWHSGFTLGLILVSASLVSHSPAAAQYGGGQSANQDSDVLPSSFRGRISYAGTYEASTTSTPRITGRSTVRDLIGALGGGRSRELAGQFNLELTFNGNAVTGRYSGSGTFGNGTLSGTRSGGQCRLIDERHGTITDAECTRTRYAGSGRSQQARNTTTFRLEGQATQFVDAAVQEEQQRLAAAQAAERQRAAEAAYAALPDAGVALTRRFNSFVQTDSRGWAFNRYDPGSMADVKVIDGSVRSGNFVMQGFYTFNGGRRGWAMAKMAGGQLECIQFWDAMIGCRGLRTPEEGQAMRDMATALINDALSPPPRQEGTCVGRDPVHRTFIELPC